MLKHYSHIRTEAKRRAVAAISRAKGNGTVEQKTEISDEAAKESAKVELVN